jgi:hypothetical protein
MIAYLWSSRSIVHLNFCGLAPRWALFADILEVGVPGLINMAIRIAVDQVKTLTETATGNYGKDRLVRLQRGQVTDPRAGDTKSE